MQTFMPRGTDYAQTAMDLDRARLGKQRLECKQIITAHLTGVGWIHHPATEMWDGHTHELALYAQAMCHEWLIRGYQDTTLPWFEHVLNTTPNTGPTWWADDATVKLTHRSNLIRKSDGYKALYGELRADYVYVWPCVRDGERQLRISKPDLKRVRNGERSLPPHAQLAADGYGSAIIPR